MDARDFTTEISAIQLPCKLTCELRERKKCYAETKHDIFLFKSSHKHIWITTIIIMIVIVY